MTQTWLLCGDVHGDARYMNQVFVLAQECAVDRIVQLGDFGFGFDDEFVASMGKLAVIHDIPLYAIDGNHEDFDWLERQLTRPEPDGTFKLAEGMFYVPRGTVFEVEGEKVLCCGGAASLDKDWRVQYEHDTNTRAWWWQETITQDDVEKCKEAGPTQILLSHDFPWEVDVVDRHLAPMWGATAQYATMENRKRVSRILAACGAREVYHGHLHLSYFERITVEGKSVGVRGLSCNGDSLSAVCHLLELGH